ncbi:MAG: outer membrane protein assembly factor BamE [Deltaproteobacteria bacterium]|nr:outer membrane protein assembly factor BamE [Deltaproteobacteria bacterium]
MLKKLIILLIPLIYTISCGPIHFKSGKPFTMSHIEAIKKGETGKEDIKNLFGEPQLAGKNDSHQDIWSYLYIEAKVPLRGGPSKEKFQRMTITFEADKVKSITYEMSKETP